MIEHFPEHRTIGENASENILHFSPIQLIL